MQKKNENENKNRAADKLKWFICDAFAMHFEIAHKKIASQITSVLFSVNAWKVWNCVWMQR